MDDKKIIIEHFDVDTPTDNENIFGMPFNYDQSELIVLPIPWNAMSSTAEGLDMQVDKNLMSIKLQTQEVDLVHPHVKDHWYRGIYMMDNLINTMIDQNNVVRALVIMGVPTEDILNKINNTADEVMHIIKSNVSKVIKDNKKPIILGGDHSVTYGAVSGVLDHHDKITILHIDAHMDCRDKYAGLTNSHASVIRNIMSDYGHRVNVISHGLRDYSKGEEDYHTKNCHIYFNHTFNHNKRFSKDLYLTFDVDALDIPYVPGTGTPVPGGLSWCDVEKLYDDIKKSNYRLVGMDIVETGDTRIDHIVTARLLWLFSGLL